jgi:hypothetical protein
MYRIIPATFSMGRQLESNLVVNPQTATLSAITHGIIFASSYTRKCRIFLAHHVVGNDCHTFHTHSSVIVVT